MGWEEPEITKDPVITAEPKDAIPPVGSNKFAPPKTTSSPSKLILAEVLPVMKYIVPLLTYKSCHAAIALPKLYCDMLSVYGPAGIRLPENVCVPTKVFEPVVAAVKAKDAVVALVAKLALVANEEEVVKLALVTKLALVAFVAKEAVPNNEPVNPAVAVAEPVIINEPVIKAEPENGNPTPWTNIVTPSFVPVGAKPETIAEPLILI